MKMKTVAGLKVSGWVRVRTVTAEIGYYKRDRDIYEGHYSASQQSGQVTLSIISEGSS